MFRILVVDDEADVCEILKFNFENNGYRVDTACSAEEAMALPLGEYNLFLLDVMMDKMSGFAFAAYLRKQPETAHKAIPPKRVSLSSSALSPRFPFLPTPGMNTSSCFIWSWLSTPDEKNKAQLTYILERGLLTKISLRNGILVIRFQITPQWLVPFSQEWQIQGTHSTQLNTAAPLW